MPKLTDIPTRTQVTAKGLSSSQLIQAQLNSHGDSYLYTLTVSINHAGSDATQNFYWPGSYVDVTQQFISGATTTRITLLSDTTLTVKGNFLSVVVFNNDPDTTRDSIISAELALGASSQLTPLSYVARNPAIVANGATILLDAPRASSSFRVLPPGNLGGNISVQIGTFAPLVYTNPPLGFVFPQFERSVQITNNTGGDWAANTLVVQFNLEV